MLYLVSDVISDAVVGWDVSGVVSVCCDSRRGGGRWQLHPVDSILPVFYSAVIHSTTSTPTCSSSDLQYLLLCHFPRLFSPSSSGSAHSFLSGW